MKSKWSKIIKLLEGDVAIETFQMMEFNPGLPSGPSQDTDQSNVQDEVPDPPHDCSLLQQQAYEAGREAGIEEGKQQVRDEVDARMKGAIGLVDQVGEARCNAVCQAEADVVALAMAIARKIVHREAALNKDVIAAMVSKAIGYLSTKGLVRVKAHPDDVSYLQTLQTSWVNREGGGVSLLIEGDHTIQPGGCVVESDSIIIDATLDRQFEIIQEGLAMEDYQDGVGESHRST